MRVGLAGLGKTVVAAIMLVAALWFAGISRERSGPSLQVERVAQTSAAPVPISASSCDDLTHLIVPVEGVRPTRLTDTFNDARAEGRRHDAIDIMAPLGTAVVVAAPGRVEKLFLSRAGGNTVYVRSPDGRILYYYAHLDRYAPGLHEGQAVLQGLRLGTVGYSGNADPAAPHLHFAITATAPQRKWWEAGRSLNPFVYLTARDGDDRLCGDAA
jgi:murein DD-endopeptidase MepM/ murein hydrolase activator NlpD